MTRQIGWYTLKEDQTFFNTFECAAWYEEVLVKAGRYPVMVLDFRVLQHADPKFDKRLTGHIDGTYIPMPGTIVSDEFGTRYFGVPIGNYDNTKHAGQPAMHKMFAYMYEVAEDVLKNPDSPWELFPEFEAREVLGEWQGETFTTCHLYAKA